MKRKKGFTLVELLAVIVILAIILVIAIPQIMNTIKAARLSAIKDSAMLIAEQANKDFITQQVLNKDYSETSILCNDVAKLNDDYDTCTITYNNGIATVTLKGKDGGKFSGITCTGTSNNMCCSYDDDETPCEVTTTFAASCSGSNTGFGTIPNGLYMVSKISGSCLESIDIAQHYLDMCKDEYTAGMESCLNDNGNDENYCLNIYGSSSDEYCDSDIQALEDEKTCMEDGDYYDYAFVDFGEELPRGTFVRNTPDLALADWKEHRDYYHDEWFIVAELDDENKLSEAYVGFHITNEMAEKNEGLVPGYYYLKGGDNGEAYSDNLNVVKSAFGCDTYTNYCSENIDSSEIFCNIYYTPDDYLEGYYSLEVYAYGPNSTSAGEVYAGINGDMPHCIVDNEHAYCYG